MLTAETWDAVWNVFVQVATTTTSGEDVAIADIGEPRDFVVEKPPVFTVQTPAWETTVAQAMRETEGV